MPSRAPICAGVADDHDNLTLAVAAVNRSKGARDAAEWQPDYNAAWMANRVVEAERQYDLSVNPLERDALERMLGSGLDAIVCEEQLPFGGAIG